MFTAPAIQTVTSAATVMIGTAFLAVAGIGIAAPARADVPAGFTQATEASVDSTLRLPYGVEGRKGVATVAVQIAADGSVQSARIVGSTGSAALDREALRTANTVHYPAPGKPQTVALVLGFNRTVGATDQARGKAIVDAYVTDSRRLLATKTTAKPIG